MLPVRLEKWNFFSPGKILAIRSKIFSFYQLDFVFMHFALLLYHFIEQDGGENIFIKNISATLNADLIVVIQFCFVD